MRDKPFGPWSSDADLPLTALVILYGAALAFALVGVVMTLP